MFQVRRSFAGKSAIALMGLSVGILPTLNTAALAQPTDLPAIRTDVRAIPGSIIPTDVVPLPAAEERLSFGENLQLQMLQRLPARLYFNASCETTFRLETNPFQFPSKRTFIRKFFPPPPVFASLNPFTQNDFFRQLSFINATDVVFRVLPNVTVGWTVTPKTRLFGNFFMIRDSLMHNVRLNTTIFSVAYGIQQDIPVTKRGNLQLEVQARELLQQNGTPVFDLLPASTFSYILTPRLVLFANALLQLRGRGYFKPATREIDPFFTFGGLYQRGGWSFSGTATYVQNWRQMFGANASIPVNNQSWICDFELARRMFPQVPGLQAFVRAEPIWNFGSHNTPGLAGFDFRLFWGLRMAVGKPPLTAAINLMRQRLEELEGEPPPPTAPNEPPATTRPSASLPTPYEPMPYELTASKPQPIHNLLATFIDDGTSLGSIHAPIDEISSTNDTTASDYPVPQTDNSETYTPVVLSD